MVKVLKSIIWQNKLIINYYIKVSLQIKLILTTYYKHISDISDIFIWLAFACPTGCPAKLFPLSHSSFSWLPSGPDIKFWKFFNSAFSVEFKNVLGFIILPIFQQDIAQLLFGTQIK